MAAANHSSSEQPQVFLPDFCAPATVLVILLVAELLAILLTLGSSPVPGTFLTELAKLSLYVLWLALLGTSVLCYARPWLERMGPNRAFIGTFLVLVGMCMVLAEIAYRLTDIFGAAAIINDTHGGFLLRTFFISTIVIALAMRYLYVSSEWRRSIVLEAQARVSALQALIRPHFLFNSMNTIAALTRSDPARAEEAVEDLADLMRANLGGPRSRTTLKEELEVAAIYQRIEKLRLGDRLRVRWDIDELPMRAMIPSLTIQPLLENAIYHGIELLPDGGDVRVTGTRSDGRLTIEVTNPVASAPERRKSGNQMALANIRQRFELAYGNRAEVSTDATEEHYRVRLAFPYDEAQA